MTSKNETGAFIRYFGNAKSELTEPETIVLYSEECFINFSGMGNIQVATKAS